jgi:serine O-acetyltransferase
MFENLRADLKRALQINVGPGRSAIFKLMLQPTTFVVINYRFGRWALNCRIPVVRHLLLFVAAFVRYFVELLTGVNITPRAQIGPGFVVHTAFGIFIAPTVIGSNCVVQHGVVIGYGTKRIGNDVWFGPGAKVMGLANIGNNVVIIANSLVMTDVPDNTTVVGVPARIRLPRGNTLKVGAGRTGNGSKARHFHKKLDEWLDQEQESEDKKEMKHRNS